MNDIVELLAILAELCIEGNEDLCGGKWTPLFAEETGLFEGSGWFLSGARFTSCEAWAQCASNRKGEHRPTIDLGPNIARAAPKVATRR